MIHVHWEFQVKPEKIVEFRRDYSADGVWARLFRKSPDYVESLLLSDPESPHRFVVVDVWKSRAAYESFKKQFSQEYAALDRTCEALAERETPLGTFEVF
jgi:quinol monooxygenase YgiN